MKDDILEGELEESNQNNGIFSSVLKTPHTPEDDELEGAHIKFLELED